MTARRRALPLALLLPILALRALLPAGYMPLAGTDGLRVVMCSDGLRLPAGLDTRDVPDDHGRLAGGGECHFSHGGAKAPPPAALTLAAVTAPILQLQLFPAEERAPVTGPPRVTGARAPPALS